MRENRCLRIQVWLCAIAVVLALPSQTRAAEIQVSGGESIQTAIDQASEGDLIMVADGVYDGFTVSKRVTIQAMAFDRQNPRSNGVKIANTIEVQGDFAWDNGPVLRGLSLASRVSKPLNIRDPAAATVEYCHIIAGADGVSFEGGGGIVRGNIIENTGDDPIDVDQQSKSILIENNKLLNGGNDGIEIRQHNVNISPRISFVMRNNQVENNGAHGLQIMDYNNFSNRHYHIERNLFLNNGESGIGMVPSSNTNDGSDKPAPMPEPLYSVNNTFVGNRAGITGGANVVAVNNIFQDNSFDLGSVGGSSRIMHNLFAAAPKLQGSSNMGANNHTGNPEMDSNYLLTVGSEAVDAGLATLSHSYTYDGSLGGSQQDHNDKVVSINSSQYSGNGPDLGWKELGSTQPPPFDPTVTQSPNSAPNPRIGDANNDGQHDYRDYQTVIGSFAKAHQHADFNGNGKVDIFDLGFLVRTIFN